MNIVITGASGGIGQSCVKALLEREGVKVFAISRSESGLSKLKAECATELNKEIYTRAVDFFNNDFENEVYQWLNKKVDHIDGIINNAGLLVNKDFSKTTKSEINEQFRINFEAPLCLIQACLPLLLNSKGKSHVVNIGSMGGYQGSEKFTGLSVYSASKGALATLTECLAAEYRSTNVSFNCLALGSANTEMLRKAFPNYTSPMSPESMAKFITDFTIEGHKYFNGKVLPVSGLNT